MSYKTEKNLKTYLVKKHSGKGEQRKLVAIMFTDIANFTALSAKDESEAIKLLEKQNKILEPIIRKFKGTIHKEIGDGLLITFPTVSNAVKCSIKIQNSVKNVKHLNLRIGIHEGEITSKKGDVFGDDINITSRIQSYSPVGGVVISGKVQQDISSLSEYKTKYIGTPQLKGVLQDTKLYCLLSHGLSTKWKNISKNNYITRLITFLFTIAFLSFIYFNSYANKYEELPSLGVVYLENICNVEDEYWINGYYEDLILEFANAGEIKVTKIHDFNMLDDSKELKKLSNDKNINFILSTNICKNDSLIELRTNLIDLKKGNSKYANKWIEKVEDSGIIINDIANNVLKNIIPNYIIKRSEGLKVNPKAKELYYKGLEKFESVKDYSEYKEIYSLLQTAMHIDPNYIKPRDLMPSVKINLNQVDDLIDFVNESYRISYSNNDTLGMISSICNIVHIDSISFDKKLKQLDEGLKLAKKYNNNLHALGRIYKKYGDLYYSESKNRKKPHEKRVQYKTNVLENYLLAYQFYNINGKVPFQLLNLIGDVHRETGNIEKAYDYYFKSLEHAQKYQVNLHSINYSKMQLAGLYQKDKKYLQSNILLLEAYDYFNELKDFNALYHIIGYMIGNYSYMNLPKEIYKRYEYYIELAENMGDYYLVGCYSILYGSFGRICDEELKLKYKELHDEVKARIAKKEEE